MSRRHRPRPSVSPWARASRIGDVQGGAIHHAQLRQAGFSSSGIGRSLADGTLVERHCGVYALGRAGLSPLGETWAAALAAGDRGAVARRSALAVRGLGPWPPEPQIVVVGGRLELIGVSLRRTRRLEAHEVEVNTDGLRATTIPRTVTDLARDLSIAELETVLDVVERAGSLDLALLDTAIGEANGRAGLRKLHIALIPFRVPPGDHRSMLERFGVLVVQKGRLPTPEINGAVHLPGHLRPLTIDVLYRDHRLAIELDGRESHTGAVQFGRDRERDRALLRAGWRVLRFTYHDVLFRPEVVIADIRAALALPLPSAVSE